MEEEINDCLMEVDKTLEELEEALQNRDYKKAHLKLREARDAIEDLREDDESVLDREQVEMDIVDKLK